MTLRMADGPVANLPAGMDAYAGYVDQSGIGATWTAVQALPAPHHLSISVHGNPAMCGDVETDALASWRGYQVGYCAISSAEVLVTADGRPERLWTAHYTGIAHICSAAYPACAAFGFTGHADGTQWTNHRGVWDESLLSDNFFDFLNPPGPGPNPQVEDLPVYTAHSATRQVQVFDSGRAILLPEPNDGTLLTNSPTPNPGRQAGLGLPYIGPFSEDYITNLLA